MLSFAKNLVHDDTGSCHCVLGCPYLQKIGPLILPKRYVIPLYEKYTSRNNKVCLHHLSLENPNWKWLWPPFRGEKNCSDYKVHGIHRPAWTHSFNAKIGFEKYEPRLEISVKMYQVLLVWFGKPIFDTFMLISWDSVHVFQNRFLHWNSESEPVNLNTMSPIIGTIFFSLIKGLEQFSIWIFQRKMK